MWTTYEDVESRWLLDEPLPDPGKVEQLIEDAEDAVLSRFPNMPATVESGAIPVRRVVRVVVALVVEAVKNPRGTRQVQSTTGPFTGSETFGGDNPGAMVLTADMIRDLTGSRRHGRPFTAPMWSGNAPVSR